jgi:hypothetical protein
MHGFGGNNVLIYNIMYLVKNSNVIPHKDD